MEHDDSDRCTLLAQRREGALSSGTLVAAGGGLLRERGGTARPPDGTGAGEPARRCRLPQFAPAFSWHARMAGLQDRPRPGGFQEIPFKRNVPVRGPSGAALVLGGIAVTVFGFSRIISGNQRRRCVAARPGVKQPGFAAGHGFALQCTALHLEWPPRTNFSPPLTSTRPFATHT